MNDRELVLNDLLPGRPYDNEGEKLYQKTAARECHVLLHNEIVCPNCSRKTRMTYRYCQKCGVDMEIPIPTYNRLIKEMVRTSK